MHIGVIIWLVLLAISLLLSAYMHGKVIDRPVSFWAVLFRVTVSVSLLAWAGVFSL